MQKLKYFIASVVAGAFLLAAPAYAQYTTVTGTVLDPNGIPYANGTITASLGPGTGPWILNGRPYAGTVPLTSLDSTGSFTAAMGDNGSITPANTRWTFTVCSNPGGIPPPLGTGNQCFTRASLTITGASQSISAQLAQTAAKLTNFVGPGTVTSIATTSPITGGTITNTGTIGCATCVTGTLSVSAAREPLVFATGSGNSVSNVANSGVTGMQLTWDPVSHALNVFTDNAGPSPYAIAGSMPVANTSQDEQAIIGYASDTLASNTDTHGVFGVWGDATMNGAGSTLAQLAGLAGQNHYTSGTVTEGAAWISKTPTGGGTVHNNYGSYVESQAGFGDTLNAAYGGDDMGSATNDYWIYSPGGKNFFAGAVKTQTGLQFGAPGASNTVTSSAVEISLTSAQIKTLHSVPITVLAAPGAGFAYLVTQIDYSLTFVTTPYTSAGALKFFYGSTAGNNASSPNSDSGFLNSVSSQVISFSGNPVTAANSTAAIANQSLVFSNLTDDPTLGDGTLKITVFYNIIPTV